MQISAPWVQQNPYLDIEFKGYMIYDVDVEKMGTKRVTIRDNIGCFLPKVYGGTTLEETWAWLKQIDIVHTL